MRLQFSAGSPSPAPQDKCMDGLRGEGFFCLKLFPIFRMLPGRVILL